MVSLPVVTPLKSSCASGECSSGGCTDRTLQGRQRTVVQTNFPFVCSKKLAVFPSLALTFYALTVPSSAIAQEADIRNIPADADAVVVVRPAMMMELPAFKKLEDETNGKASWLVNALMEDTLFQMALAKPSEIDLITIAARQQDHYPDPQAFWVMIIRTKKDQLQRLEMATHAGKDVHEYGGTQFFELKRGGLSGYRYVHIIDPTTIAWSWTPQGVKSVIDAQSSDHQQCKWHSVWLPFSKAPVSVAANQRILKNIPIPDSLKKVDVFSAGLTIDKDYKFRLSLQCSDHSIAGQLAKSMQEFATAQIAQLAETKSRLNEIDRSAPFELGQKWLERLRVVAKGDRVEARSSIPIKLKALIPAIESYVTEARRSKDVAKLRRIGIAISNYEHSYGPFGRVFEHQGKRHSWRVGLLLLLGESLHYEYRFEEEWDSPHNQRVTAHMPSVYRSSLDQSEAAKSSWQVVYGPQTLFQNGKKLKNADIKDGPQNTLMLVEAKSNSHWAKPEDIRSDTDLAQALGGFDSDGFHALFADGSVKFILQDTAPDALRQLINPADGPTSSPETSIK